VRALRAPPAGPLDRDPAGQRAGRVVAEPPVGHQRPHRQQPPRPVPQLGVALLGPAQAHAGALGLDAPGGARPDRLGGQRVQVLPARLVDPVVVRSQEARDHRVDAAGAVGERLPGQHRGQLHHAGPVIWAAVLAL
jgi:hypothetical protein